MKLYYIKVWSDFYTTWQLSGAREVCNPYHDLNAVYAVMTRANMSSSWSYRYTVVDDKNAQPPKPS